MQEVHSAIESAWQDERAFDLDDAQRQAEDNQTPEYRKALNDFEKEANRVVSRWIEEHPDYETDRYGDDIGKMGEDDIAWNTWATMVGHGVGFWEDLSKKDYASLKKQIDGDKKLQKAQGRLETEIQNLAYQAESEVREAAGMEEKPRRKKRAPKRRKAKRPLKGRRKKNRRGKRGIKEHVACGTKISDRKCRQLQHVYKSARKKGASKTSAAQQAREAVKRSKNPRGKGTSVPSAKKLQESFRDLDAKQAKLIRSIAGATDDPEKLEKLIEQVPDTERYVRRMHHSPYDSKMWRMTVALHAIDRILGGHGVEALGKGDYPSYAPPYEYVNVGDTYAETLIYDRKKDRLFLSSWGDVVERHPKLLGEDGYEENPRGKGAMRYFLVPYTAWEEGAYVMNKVVIVRARTQADVEQAIDEETHEGDFPPELVTAMGTDEFGGSSVERAGDSFYYVPGYPEEDDGETPTFNVQYGAARSFATLEDAEEAALRELKVYEPLFYAVDARGGFHEVKERGKNPRGKRCPPGKIPVDRKGYRRKGSKGRKGAAVKRSTFCVKDRGRKGKTSFGAEGGPRSRQKPLITRRGKLGGPGYTRKPASQRHTLLRKCVKKYGYRSCLGSLQVLTRSSEIGPSVRHVVEGDSDWLMKEFGGRKGNPAEEARVRVFLEYVDGTTSHETFTVRASTEEQAEKVAEAKAYREALNADHLTSAEAVSVKWVSSENQGGSLAGEAEVMECVCALGFVQEDEVAARARMLATGEMD